MGNKIQIEKEIRTPYHYQNQPQHAQTILTYPQNPIFWYSTPYQIKKQIFIKKRIACKKHTKKMCKI